MNPTFFCLNFASCPSDKTETFTPPISTLPLVGFEVGDTVKVIDGPLEGFLGTVEELEPEKDRVRVVVSMFGRETPVDLELDQVETVKD